MTSYIFVIFDYVDNDIHGRELVVVEGKNHNENEFMNWLITNINQCKANIQLNGHNNKSNIDLILENMPLVPENIHLASSVNIFWDRGHIFQYSVYIWYIYSYGRNHS